MVSRKSVKWGQISSLMLDPANPRHEPDMSRKEIIQYLISRESVLNLAKDIATFGLSPLELFGGIDMGDGDILIVEGNRRLCALILLHDPKLAPAKEQKTFEKLRKQIDPNLLVDITIFSEQSEADIWIERKHSGLANGVGPRPWNATQKTRHYGASSGNSLALALMDYAEKAGLISAEERQSGIITTITRFVSNPYVRMSGLRIHTGRDNTEFRFDGSQDEFKYKLGILLRDIISGANGATSRTSVGEREAYARTYLVPATPPILGGSPVEEKTDRRVEAESKSASENENPNLLTANTKNSSSAHPGKRLKLLAEDFNPELKSNQLIRILIELKEARRTAPISTALLVRVFMEAISVKYLQVHLGYVAQDRDKLHILVHKVLNDIERRKSEGEIQLSKAQGSALRSLMGEISSSSFVFSASYLGRVAHGSAFPEWSNLTGRWDEIESIVSYIASVCEKKL